MFKEEHGLSFSLTSRVSPQVAVVRFCVSLLATLLGFTALFFLAGFFRGFTTFVLALSEILARIVLFGGGRTGRFGNLELGPRNVLSHIKEHVGGLRDKRIFRNGANTAVVITVPRLRVISATAECSIMATSKGTKVVLSK
jgi:hypothetical protein